MILIRSSVVTTFINLFLLINIIRIAPSLSQNDTDTNTTTPSPVTADTLSETISTLPSSIPSESLPPSGHPTSTHPPSVLPTGSPSLIPSVVPTNVPSKDPTGTPSTNPTTSAPSNSTQPSLTPSLAPSVTHSPTNSLAPSFAPSSGPSVLQPWTCSDSNWDRIEKGKTTRICVFVSHGGSWMRGMTYKRWVFEPKADEFSQMAFKDSYKDLVTHDSEFQGKLKDLPAPIAKPKDKPHQNTTKTNNKNNHNNNKNHNNRLLDTTNTTSTNSTSNSTDGNNETTPVIDIWGVNHTQHVHVFVASQEKTSFLRRYYDEEEKRIYPYLTAIIDVDEGIVKGITWDQADMYCNSCHARENTFNFKGRPVKGGKIITHSKGCFFTQQECNEKYFNETKGAKTCDLKIYFAWTGTDVKGRPLTSVNSVYSKFNNVPQVSGEGQCLIDAAKDKIDGVRTDISDKVDNMIDGVKDDIDGIKDSVVDGVTQGLGGGQNAEDEETT